MSRQDPERELAQLLSSEPRSSAFVRICELVDTWPTATSLPAVLERAERALEGWPDEVRFAHGDAFDALVSGDYPASARLVRSLEIPATRCTAEGVSELLSRSDLSALRCLRVSVRDHRGWLEALIGATHLSRLHTLDLRHVGLGDEGLAALASARLPFTLQKLVLDGNRLRAASITHLRAFAHVSSLWLSHNELGADGCAALAGLEMPNLEELWLEHAELDAPALAALSRAPWAKRLRVLQLRGNDIGDALTVLGGGVGQLEQLGLSKVGLRTTHWVAFAERADLRALSVLDVSENALPGPFAFALIGGSPLRALEIVRLYRCELDDEAAQLLLTAPELEGLAELDVESNFIAEDAQEALMALALRRGVLVHLGGNPRPADEPHYADDEARLAAIFASPDEGGE